MSYRIIIFILFLFAPLYAKQKICLNMIVKDESAVIQRCLDSVKPLIDYWVIVDTGSTDGTQTIIRKHMKGIPGELIERPWKNFGYNRSEAFDLAKGKGDYILLIDADDVLNYPKNYKFPLLKDECYQMWRGTEDFSYLHPQLIKGNMPWKWVGVTHEYLSCDSSFCCTALKDIKYVSCGGGARSYDPEKFLKNVRLLEAGLKEEPDNVRYVFYLAESYRDAGMLEKAIENYEKRAAMGGWQEEIFWSLYQIAYLKEFLNKPHDEIIRAYYKAHHFRPERCEPIYRLAALYNKTDQHILAFECIKGWLAIPKPQTKDILFNETWMERWGIGFELSLASYYVGEYLESLSICDSLLKQDDLASAVKEQINHNKAFVIKKLKELASHELSKA